MTQICVLLAYVTLRSFLLRFSYRGDQGWAPAMFLRKVSGGDSSPTSNGKMDVLDIVSFNGGKL